MMPPVPLPTDNLYKFCALVGVVIIAISSYCFCTRADTVARLRIRGAADATKLEIELADLQAVMDIDTRKSDALARQRTWEDDMAAREAQVTQHRQRLNAIERTNADLHAIAKEEALATAELDALGCVGGFVVLLGSGIATYGFANWRKLQIIQDQLSKRQLAKQPSDAHEPPIC